MFKFLGKFFAKIKSMLLPTLVYIFINLSHSSFASSMTDNNADLSVSSCAQTLSGSFAINLPLPIAKDFSRESSLQVSQWGSLHSADYPPFWPVDGDHVFLLARINKHKWVLAHSLEIPPELLNESLDLSKSFVVGHKSLYNQIREAFPTPHEIEVFGSGEFYVLSGQIREIYGRSSFFPSEHQHLLFTLNMLKNLWQAPIDDFTRLVTYDMRPLPPERHLYGSENSQQPYLRAKAALKYKNDSYAKQIGELLTQLHKTLLIIGFPRNSQNKTPMTHINAVLDYDQFNENLTLAEMSTVNIEDWTLLLLSLKQLEHDGLVLTSLRIVNNQLQIKQAIFRFVGMLLMKYNELSLDTSQKVHLVNYFNYVYNKLDDLP